MRSNEYVPPDINFPVTYCSFRSPIKVGDDRRPNADRRVVADRYAFGMQFVDVNELTNPDLVPDFDAAYLVEPWS